MRLSIPKIHIFRIRITLVHSFCTYDAFIVLSTFMKIFALYCDLFVIL